MGLQDADQHAPAPPNASTACRNHYFATSPHGTTVFQKEKIRENKEKIKLNKQLPWLVGNVVEVRRPVMCPHQAIVVVVVVVGVAARVAVACLGILRPGLGDISAAIICMILTCRLSEVQDMVLDLDRCEISGKR